MNFRDREFGTETLLSKVDDFFGRFLGNFEQRLTVMAAIVVINIQPVIVYMSSRDCSAGVAPGMPTPEMIWDKAPPRMCVATSKTTFVTASYPILKISPAPLLNESCRLLSSKIKAAEFVHQQAVLGALAAMNFCLKSKLISREQIR